MHLVGRHLQGYMIVKLNVKCASIKSCDLQDTVGSVYVLQAHFRLRLLFSLNKT